MKRNVVIEAMGGQIHEMVGWLGFWESWEKMEDEEDGHKVVKWLMKLEDIYMSV